MIARGLPPARTAVPGPCEALLRASTEHRLVRLRAGGGSGGEGEGCHTYKGDNIVAALHVARITATTSRS